VLADITPVIITLDEAPNIGRSLERLTWAREVVIVDSGSTDETLAIAGRFPNVRTIHRPFDSLARQWTFAAGETGVTTEWILRLDADYMVEPAFRDELGALHPPSDIVAYEAPFTYCIDGRPLRGSLYPTKPVLFRRGRVGFVQDGHTERMLVQGAIGRLHSRLLHDDRKSLERWLQSQARYQRAEAEKLATQPWMALGWADRLRRTRVLGPPAAAIHCLLFKGLILDGPAGLFYAAQRVVAELILSLHLLRRDLDGVLATKASR
jgi:glycosyltransferase involved in cell wall biosynthesis